jgi:hypothetical protein
MAPSTKQRKIDRFAELVGSGLLSQHEAPRAVGISEHDAESPAQCKQFASGFLTSSAGAAARGRARLAPCSAARSNPRPMRRRELKRAAGGGSASRSRQMTTNRAVVRDTPEKDLAHLVLAPLIAMR